MIDQIRRGTPQILDLLRQYKAEATFFMIGFRVQRNPYLVKQVLKEGHEIGNHTMNHLYASNSSDEKLENDILDGKKFFEKWVKEPLLFRPLADILTMLYLKQRERLAIKLFYGRGIKIHVIGRIRG